MFAGFCATVATLDWDYKDEPDLLKAAIEYLQQGGRSAGSSGMIGLREAYERGKAGKLRS